MQAISDMFLGWTAGAQPASIFAGAKLRDMQGRVVVEAMVPTVLTLHARRRGWMLTRAQDRSEHPVALARCLSERDTFDRFVSDFSATPIRTSGTAGRLIEAFGSGRMRAVEGVLSRESAPSTPPRSGSVCRAA